LDQNLLGKSIIGKTHIKILETMKKVILTLCSILVVVGAYAQGTVNFNNRVTGSGIDAPVFVGAIGGAKADGTAYLAQLYAGPSDTALAAIGEAVAFRTGAAAGYVTVAASTRTIGTVAPDAIARVQIRAWAVASGATYELASAAGGLVGQSGILGIKTGGAGSPPSLPADLVGLTSFAIAGGPVIPEPSILALGALGGLALLLRRRK
jgi:hypothetical protein